MQIDEKVGRDISTNIQNAVKSIDDSVLTQIDLFKAFIEGARSSNVPVSIEQMLFEDCSNLIQNTIATRRGVEKMTRKMTKLKSKSNLDVFSLGCKDGLTPGFSSGKTNVTHIKKVA